MNTHRRIAILQRGISKHRLPFYEALREALQAHNVELVLVHGHFAPWDNTKGDLATIPWARVIRNRVLRIAAKEIYWQPAVFLFRGYDLVIVEQANRLLINYPLQLLRRLLGYKLAYWGHGKDFQSSEPNGLLQRFKAFYTSHVDWWFAYTDLSRKLVANSGMHQERITVVQNAGDTDVLENALDQLSDDSLARARIESGVSSSNIAVYCGGLYENKRLSFLLDATDRIRKMVPDFEFLVIGNGPDAELVREKAIERPWLHYLGPMFGSDRVPYMKLAKIQLMPGAVGLGIVDSFLLEVPLITTDITSHGPEICYLEHETNGLQTSDDIAAFSDTAAALLCDEAFLFKLKEGCRSSARNYTVENMTRNFTAGVLQCLEVNQT